MTKLDIFLRLISLLILIYFFAVSLTYVFLFILSFFGLLHHQIKNRFSTPNEILKAKITPPVSIIAPAYNEEKGIVSNVYSLLALKYGLFEVIVVNDGSADNTLETLKREFTLRKTAREYHPQIPTKEVRAIYKSQTISNLIVVDKSNGGKADSLNAGINVSLYPLFCCIDADSALERTSLLQIVHPFMEAYSRVTATGGLVRVANGCAFEEGRCVRVRTPEKWLPAFQIVEYFRAFLSGRMGLSMLGCLLVISGAFGLFKKEPVIQAGGYRTDIVGEDMELVVRLHRQFRRKESRAAIVFVPDPVCWTEAPESWKILSRQRNRWQRGLAESLFAHISMLLNPFYGTTGMISMPFFFFIEFLSPAVEFVGYFIFAAAYVRGAVDIYAVAAFFLFAIGFGVVLSLLSLLLEEITFHRYPNLRDLAKLILAAILENFGYRQYLTLVRGKGMIDWLSGKKMWGEMERKGI
ncbi:MAG: glycosyltransferase [Endomicrobiales bacterium]|nr:glycosyltransferase [Endomicrobiales bacterium]